MKAQKRTPKRPFLCPAVPFDNLAKERMITGNKPPERRFFEQEDIQALQ
jgi:hypothetical protein